MKEQRGYIPPRYIPLGQLDQEESDLEKSILSDVSPTKIETDNDAPVMWSSGICACFDDLQSYKMKEQRGYIPPRYIPLGQLDQEESDLEKSILSDVSPTKIETDNDAPVMWSSGICACFDDLQSCFIGTICPCYLFGKNAEFLGPNSFMGSCTTHFIICGLINSCCCLASGGLLLGFPGCFTASYACGYRKALRAKYNLQEAPCGDFVTHLCCHLCAVCQEYREIRERSVDINLNANMVDITAPEVQTMDLAVRK